MTRQMVVALVLGELDSIGVVKWWIDVGSSQ